MSGGIAFSEEPTNKAVFIFSVNEQGLISGSAMVLDWTVGYVQSGTLHTIWFRYAHAITSTTCRAALEVHHIVHIDTLSPFQRVNTIYTHHQRRQCEP